MLHAWELSSEQSPDCSQHSGVPPAGASVKILIAFWDADLHGITELPPSAFKCRAEASNKHESSKKHVTSEAHSHLMHTSSSLVR
jgi:hypothetical protein